MRSGSGDTARGREWKLTISMMTFDDIAIIFLSGARAATELQEVPEVEKG
jgi:hypothetical protein